MALTATPGNIVLEADSPLSSTISARNEVDRYGINVVPGQIFNITATSIETMYPWVRVVDVSGRELADIGEARDKKFVTTSVQAPSGDVFVEVSTYGGYRTGQYQLELWIQDEPTKLLDAVLIHTNHERMSRGLVPLGRDNRLDSAAQSHTDDMVRNDFFSHTGRNGSSASQRVTQAGFSWTAVGENIAQGQRDAASVVSAWMNSSGHRENILRTSFQEIGLGYGFSGTTGKLYWTQVFGTETNSIVDTTRPAFSSAAMSADGGQVILTYSEPLSFMTAPAPAFQVTVDGGAASISSATVSGSTVVLSLGTPAESGQSITVAYTAPASTDHVYAIQDATGNDAVSLPATPVLIQGPSLTMGAGGHLFVNGQSVTYAGSPVTESFFSWTIFEATVIRGQRVFFAQHTSGRVHRKLANDNWALEGGLDGVGSAYSIDLPRSARGPNFPVTQEPALWPNDLRIPLENSGTALRIDSQGRLYADIVPLITGASLGITLSGLPGFSPLAVMRTNTDAAWKSTVLWQSRVNQSLVEWQFDDNWNYRGTFRVPTESVESLELAYQIDINRDTHLG